MRLADFDFPLPRELVAAHPAEPREAARLLVVQAARDFADRHIADLPELLRPGDVLVFNDTKVIPARLVGRRGQARIEMTLHRDLGGGNWRAFAKGARRLRPGDRVVFADDFVATVAEKHLEGDVTLAFGLDPAAFRVGLQRHGAMPLPPYIPRPEGSDSRDRADYQTMFARHEGAVAAPTAGLHFTPGLLKAIEARGVEWLTVTLHVGPGTFLPVKEDDPRDHKMHAEWGILTEDAAARLNRVRAEGGRIVAVGTTSLRLLETAVSASGEFRPFAGETRLYILPGAKVRAIDLILTNFHLPRSTLLMLVAALAGLDRIKAAYAHAVESGYRFFSYGDACLIEVADLDRGRPARSSPTDAGGTPAVQS
ncbi:MAG TPA: tRNA preQ1(34) S-adenosylmethionine ribosyltransferase-isomerase QueA [Stellaceae bacterium]|jgi:S-adenosylmethionine:tRNA ribosyltransferase-isomerase|nr:tRNA preQ1(34) S-adenosylmethionine ribosyltransferase-isomerase QueA [Stellaceae bacterium]